MTQPDDDAAAAAREQLLASMSATADLVATISGQRQQYLDAGWDLVSASQIITAMWQTAAADKWLEVLRFYPAAQQPTQGD
ncbi:MAG TPA: hypothetical protein VGL39_27580 [Jatrophihabitantaceae bacterium]|jgi:predicted Zn-dependent peptidase